jgi:hypothetical protein
LRGQPHSPWPAIIQAALVPLSTGANGFILAPRRPKLGSPDDCGAVLALPPAQSAVVAAGRALFFAGIIWENRWRRGGYVPAEIE